MTKRRSVTTFAALALLCCLAVKEAESQSKGGPPPPQYPQPQYPQPQYPQPKPQPQYPQPQTPAKPQPQYPQPQTPAKPQPQYPQPQTPAKPQPQYPQPQTPAKPQPQYPQPQTPAKPQPQYPQPQTPAKPQPQYPQPQTPAKPQPQYPQPQTPGKPNYPRPQVPSKPQNPSHVSAPKQPIKMAADFQQGSQYPAGPQVPIGSQYPSGPSFQSPPYYPSAGHSQPGPNYGSPPGYTKPAPQPQTPPSYNKPGQKTSYDQAVQEPQVPQRKPQYAAPAVPPVKSCNVDRQVRVPCGVPGLSRDECEAIDCCHDGQSCFFGTTVTVQCTKDAHFIVVVSRDVTLPNIDLETLSLLGQGQGCTHVDANSAFAIYHFPVTACGSVVMEEPGVLIYENRMTSSYEVAVGDLGVITRDSHYEVLFQCRYIGTSVETLVAEVLPLDNPPLPVAEFGPLQVHLRLGNGECSSKGCNEVDVAYTSYFLDSDYPVTKVLRDPVYVEVLLLGKSDASLVLTLGRCWATTSRNAHSLPQWDILIDGCPYRDDRYLSALVPVQHSSGVEFPSHYKRFLFKMFTFVDPSSMEPLREQIYIHCSTAVCVPGQGVSCEPSCYRKKRDTGATEQTVVEPKIVVSSEEVIMTAMPAPEQ